MKLNESKEMWVVQDGEGNLITYTMANKEDVSKYLAIGDKVGKWDELSTRFGWQCIPVNILITPKDG